MDETNVWIQALLHIKFITNTLSLCVIIVSIMHLTEKLLNHKKNLRSHNDRLVVIIFLSSLVQSLLKLHTPLSSSDCAPLKVIEMIANLISISTFLLLSILIIMVLQKKSIQYFGVFIGGVYLVLVIWSIHIVS